MKRVSKWLLWLVVLGGLLFTVTASASPTGDNNIVSLGITEMTATPAPQPPATPKAAEPIMDWSALMIPVGTCIATILGGVALVVKNVNDGKKLVIDDSKERLIAERAQNKQDMIELNAKIDSLEDKLTLTLKKMEDQQLEFLERKTSFTEEMVKMERTHRAQLQSAHDTLMIEIHTRHKLEQILTENGIAVPVTPPPYTVADVASTNFVDHVEATHAIKNGIEEDKQADDSWE